MTVSIHHVHAALMEIPNPRAEAWKRLEEDARGRGLVHGMKALEYLPRHCGPADAADLLAQMVQAKVLVPCKLDLAGAGPSRRAFLGLVYRRGSIPKEWQPAHADLWTYEVPRG